MARQIDFDVIVIGGGIVGLASAYELAVNHRSVSIAVIEKEDRLAFHQTGHNSGVIHSGLYYKPGSQKAATCTAGRRKLVAFAKEHKIPHDICGKIIVATRSRELPNLERIHDNGVKNGIEGLERIDAARIRQIEPQCAGMAGLYVPCAGIIDYVAVSNKLAELIQAQSVNNKVLLSHTATGFDRHDFYTKVITSRQSFTTRLVINCAGLQSDRVARLDNVDAKMRIVPFRGDYYELKEHAGGKIRNLIYPVPDPQFPFLGVHFTRMTGGTVECGPSAVFSFKREGYSKLDFSFKDTWDALSFKGTWLMFAGHLGYGVGEYTRAFCKPLFVRQLQRLVPSIAADDLVPGNSGVRAQALGRNGRLIDDFAIEQRGNSIHVLNAPSPAATASLAIGEHVSQSAIQFLKSHTC